MHLQIDFKAIANSSTNYKSRGDSSNRYFREHFGEDPSVVASVWLCLLEQEYMSPNAKPKHLLWMLYWWKTYSVLGVCAAFCQTHHTTFTYWKERMKNAVASLDVIDFELRHDDSNGSSAKVSVDGVDCPVEETSPFDPTLWSHKLNNAGLRYEIGIAVQTGKIVWVNGPYHPGPWLDIRIFRHGLMHHLEPNEYIVGDGGYKDGNNFVISKYWGPEWFQQMTAMVMSRHETVNSRFKKYKILSTAFRHGLDNHGDTFCAIANVVQIGLDTHPAFSVDYNDNDVIG